MKKTKKQKTKQSIKRKRIREKIKKKAARRMPEEPAAKKDIMSRIKDFVFIEEPKEVIKVVPMQHSRIKLGANCPYKSYKCSGLEFLAGIVVGLIVGLFLLSVV